MIHPQSAISKWSSQRPTAGLLASFTRFVTASLALYQPVKKQLSYNERCPRGDCSITALRAAFFEAEVVRPKQRHPLNLFIDNSEIRGCVLMYLSIVEIKNFRSFETLRVDLQSGLNVLVGRNNTGKTNLLAGYSPRGGPKCFAWRCSLAGP